MICGLTVPYNIIIEDKKRETGGDILAKDILIKIREAEAQAQKIREDGALEAKKRLNDAEAAGKRLCEQTDLRANAENAEKLKLMRDKAQEMTEKNRSAAISEAKDVISAADHNMREAVRLIVGGVMDKCQ